MEVVYRIQVIPRLECAASQRAAEPDTNCKGLRVVEVGVYGVDWPDIYVESRFLQVLPASSLSHLLAPLHVSAWNAPSAHVLATGPSPQKDMLTIQQHNRHTHGGVSVEDELTSLTHQPLLIATWHELKVVATFGAEAIGRHILR